VVDSIAVRRVWQQFSRLTLLYIVLPCVADVSIVNCAVCQQFNKRTLLTDIIIPRLALDVFYLHTKFGDSRFSRSG